MHLHGGDIYRNKNMIDFSSNINMLGTPKNVIKAGCRGVKLSKNYPDVFCNDLKAAIADKEGIKEEYILCGNGAAELIFGVVQSLRPKKALLPVPSFFEYEQALMSICDCEISYFYMAEENGFRLSEEILEKITSDIEILFLCNPNNPTGTLIERKLLFEILRKCEEKEVFLVLDECFNDILEEPGKYSLKDMIYESENLFILKAFTKMYGMAGVRLGYGFCKNSQIIERMGQVLQPWNVSIPAQMAGIAAFKEERFIREFKKILVKEKKYLVENLVKLGFEVFDSKANYIFIKSDLDLYEKCYTNNFLIRDCSNYVGLGKGFYRIAVKKHKDNKKLINYLKSSTF